MDVDHRLIPETNNGVKMQNIQLQAATRDPCIKHSHYFRLWLTEASSNQDQAKLSDSCG